MTEHAINLSDDELLVLFEWSNRFCDTESLGFAHHAEAVVLDKIAGILEKRTAEAFSPNYGKLLADARSRIVQNHAERMGSDSWVLQQPLKQE